MNVQPQTRPVVYKFGLGEPFNWGDDCSDELRRENTFWNALVEIEHDHVARVRALMMEDPKVAALQHRIEALKAQIADLRERRIKEKRAKNLAEVARLDARIKAARPAMVKAIEEAKAAGKAARAVRKPQLDALNDQRFEAAKKARQDSGLYWGNYNAVFQSYERARSAAMKSKAELRFHRFDGSGRITNQIQGGITVEQLFNGTHSQVQCEPLPPGCYDIASPSARSRASRTVLSATIYTGPKRQRRLVRWPVMMHRPLPANGRIQEVVVHREKLGDTFRWSVTFLLRVPVENVQPRLGGAVAVDLGWRRTPEGLRVATFMRDDGKAEFVTLPTRECDDFFDKIRSERAQSFALISQFLLSLPADTAPDALRDALCRYRQIAEKSRRARHAATIVNLWRRDHKEWRPDDLTDAEIWLSGNPRQPSGGRASVDSCRERWGERRAWLAETNGRDQRLAHRRELYRKAARRIIGDAATVILEDFDLSKAARLTDDNPLYPAARANRQKAGVHELRLWIKHQAAKVGAQIVIHQGVSTWLCSQCNHLLKPHTPASLIQQCPHCNAHVFDQDVEACRNMLAAHYASGQIAAE